jgi:murein DD-endopeptidase MepM/ murein hydrolase activator NlpD
MWKCRTWMCAAGVLVVALLCAPIAQARSSSANTAALQVALRALKHYNGGIDGIPGPRTKRAVRRFQRSHHLHADGVAGPRTRRALGRRGTPRLGSRIMVQGQRGWDVAALQFMLRRRGYNPGSVDGGFGQGTENALKRFQAAAGITADGAAGKATLRALRHSRQRTSTQPVSNPGGPIRFLLPLNAPRGDGFGYPGGRRHDGIDFPAPMGSAVGAAGRGTVSFAGWNSGGYGNLMVVRHRDGYETWYAHLSAFRVGNGTAVAGGVRIASVGSTGRSTGPHLHFEVRHNGTPVDPAPLLLPQSSVKLALKSGSEGAHAGDIDPNCPIGHAMPRPKKRENPRTAKLPTC